jgi:hypothetical protein
MRRQSAGLLTLFALYFPRHFVASSDFTRNKNKKMSRRVSLNYLRIVVSRVSVKMNSLEVRDQICGTHMYMKRCIKLFLLGLPAIFTERGAETNTSTTVNRASFDMDSSASWRLELAT